MPTGSAKPACRRCKSIPARAVIWMREWSATPPLRLDPPTARLLFIENVGNLVCPAAFDLGEAQRVVMLSVTEGEDNRSSIPTCFMPRISWYQPRPICCPMCPSMSSAASVLRAVSIPRSRSSQLSALTGDGTGRLVRVDRPAARGGGHPARGRARGGRMIHGRRRCRSGADNTVDAMIRVFAPSADGASRSARS